MVVSCWSLLIFVRWVVWCSTALPYKTWKRSNMCKYRWIDDVGVLLRWYNCDRDTSGGVKGSTSSLDARWCISSSFAK